MSIINNLLDEMINYYGGDPKRIQHFIKVHSFANLIAEHENLDAKTKLTLEIAALLHDIGIKIAEEKFGNCNGKLQEQEGPKVAEPLMQRLNIDDSIQARVLYLIAHHHTYNNIDGIDYQILVEADFLVNLYENSSNSEAINSAYNSIFKTESGRTICKAMFML